MLLDPTSISFQSRQFLELSGIFQKLPYSCPSKIYINSLQSRLEVWHQISTLQSCQDFLEMALKLFVLFTVLVASNCLNDDLRRYSVVYGVASLAKSNGTQCMQHLSDFFAGVEEKHTWALKGKQVIQFNKSHVNYKC